MGEFLTNFAGFLMQIRKVEVLFVMMAFLQGHVGMFLQTFCLLAIEEGLTTCLQEAW